MAETWPRGRAIEKPWTISPGCIRRKGMRKKSAILRRFLFILFLVFPLLAWNAAAATPAMPALVLSGCEYDYPPYCIVNPDDTATGFSVELLRAALKAVGRDVSFKTGAWSDIKSDLEKGRIQVLPLVGRTPEREAIFDFTFPYLTMHGAIFVREDNGDIAVPGDLKGKSVAVLKGDNAEEYLRRSNLGARIVPLETFEAAFKGLSEGAYDAVVAQKLMGMQILQNNGIANLKTVGPPLTDFTQSFCFATREGDTELLALLNEGLSIVIAEGIFRELYATWFSGLEALAQRKSRIIVGGDSNYPPYEFLDEKGNPAGFNVDLTKAIAEELGFDIQIRLGPWGEIRQALSDGTIDVIQGMYYSVERDRIYSFSPGYATVNHVVAARSGLEIPEDVKDLRGRKIVVMAGDVMEDLAMSLGFEENLVRVGSQEDALLLLSRGEEDYALVGQIPAQYFLKRQKIKNVTLSSSPILSPEYCYAAPNASGALVSQFSQGLAAVLAKGRYRAIENKWLAPYRAEGGRFATIAKYAAFVISILGILLLATLLWSWALRRSVKQKTHQLSIEIAERKKAEEEIKVLNQDLERRVAARTSELENALKELESFSYAVSHDLRAPLRAMEGFSSILADSYNKGLDAQGLNYLERIRNASSRMGKLIDDLLSLSKVSRHQLERKEIDMSALAAEVVSRVAEEWEGNPPEVHIEEGMRAVADPALMDILLKNLIENAYKYSARAASPRIDVGMEKQVFFVRDNGVGFDMEFAGELFAPFHRLHSIEEFSGTGIGLATVKRIVIRHGGKVWPEAKPGEGACFRFTLE
jgi:ABC-type amino acid transport substrate-binding protein/nitrogen-specific signal transduction histidine kinase